ncbi:MAG TPA: type II toxin-antitoxin system RelE/ParE family toxin [Pyrinomonadaceae bacterium]|nr:type II toxin-antitoxin system RelE/ParE family toxin [Pyrinomonadaceae bacterium]
MDYQVVLSPSARADLRDIVRYISFDAPDRALQFGLFLTSRTRLLAQSPELGRIVPEFEDPFIREIVVRSYRVVYRVDNSRRLVEVIRFWHAARGTPEINA